MLPLNIDSILFWQITGSIGTIAAIIITVVLRRRKELSFKIITFSSLISVDNVLEDTVKILFQGNPIEDLHLIILRFTNSGNLPIKSTDFKKPLGFSFGENSWVLECNIIDKNPQSLEPVVEKRKNGVIISPLLLNPKDSVKIKLLVSKPETVIQTGRIVGIHQVTKKIHRNRKLDALGIVLVIIGMITSVYATYIVHSGSLFTIGIMISSTGWITSRIAVGR